VPLFNVKAVDITQEAVVGLGDDRQQPRLRRVALLQRPLDERVAHHPDAVHVGDHNCTREKARLLGPSRPRHLTVAVENADTDEYWVAGFTPWQHRRHACPHRTLPNDQRPLPVTEGGVADLDAGHVGDGVTGTWGASERNPEVRYRYRIRLATSWSP